MAWFDRPEVKATRVALIAALKLVYANLVSINQHNTVRPDNQRSAFLCQSIHHLARSGEVPQRVADLLKFCILQQLVYGKGLNMVQANCLEWWMERAGPPGFQVTQHNEGDFILYRLCWVEKMIYDLENS